MKNYVFIYYGGGDMNDGPDDAVTKAWMDWFAGLGDKVVDAGNPFNPGGKAVDSKGVMDVMKPAATGYSIVKAGSMDDATALAQTCPLISAGGAVCVYETMPM